MGRVSHRQVLIERCNYGMPLPEKMPLLIPVILAGSTQLHGHKVVHTSLRQVVIKLYRYGWQSKKIEETTQQNANELLYTCREILLNREGYWRGQVSIL